MEGDYIRDLRGCRDDDLNLGIRADQLAVNVDNQIIKVSRCCEGLGDEDTVQLYSYITARARFSQQDEFS